MAAYPWVCLAIRGFNLDLLAAEVRAGYFVVISSEQEQTERTEILVEVSVSSVVHHRNSLLSLPEMTRFVMFDKVAHCGRACPGKSRFVLFIGSLMSLNKKQKKQLDVEHKKLKQLQLQLAGAKGQLDDPDEVARLEKEIAATHGRLEKLKQSD